jgi:multicomponent Na+:H+ antiporter subunit E
MSRVEHPLTRRASRYLVPLLLTSLLWLLLVRGEVSSLVVGIPFVVLATLAWLRLSAPTGHRFSPLALLRFLPWFAWNSLRGGLDVAHRALSPALPLKPGFVHYPLTIPPGMARVFLVNCVSLLPGTLSTELRGDELILHALDTDLDVLGDTRAVERQVQQLFSLHTDQPDA